jgi:hypothetical protein
MHRYVRRGSKGIALIDNRHGRQQLKYVFDIADTGENHRRNNPRTPYLWEMKPEHEPVVTDSLAMVYGKHGNDLTSQLMGVAERLSREVYLEYMRDLRYNTQGSQLEKMDSFTLAATFRDALTQSVAYTLSARCGLDTAELFAADDFNAVLNFNTSNSLNILGAAVSDLSEQALRQIERTIKTYEHEKYKETDRGQKNVINLFAERGLSNTQHSVTRTGQPPDREVRTHENELPQGTSERVLQHTDNERHVEQPLSGN